jgi:hypothetical protein
MCAVFCCVLVRKVIHACARSVVEDSWTTMRFRLSSSLFSASTMLPLWISAWPLRINRCLSFVGTNRGSCGAADSLVQANVSVAFVAHEDLIPYQPSERHVFSHSGVFEVRVPRLAAGAAVCAHGAGPNSTLNRFLLEWRTRGEWCVELLTLFVAVLLLLTLLTVPHVATELHRIVAPATAALVCSLHFSTRHSRHGRQGILWLLR